MIQLYLIHVRTWAHRPRTWPALLAASTTAAVLALLPGLVPVARKVDDAWALVTMLVGLAAAGQLALFSFVRLTVRTDLSVKASSSPPSPREVRSLPVRERTRLAAWVLALSTAWILAAVPVGVFVAIGLRAPGTVAVALALGLVASVGTGTLAVLAPPFPGRAHRPWRPPGPALPWRRALARVRHFPGFPLAYAFTFCVLMGPVMGMPSDLVVSLAPLLFLIATLWPLAPGSRSGDGLDVLRRLPVPPREGFRHLAGVSAGRGLVPALIVALGGALWLPAWGRELALDGGVPALVALGLALAIVTAGGVAPGGAPDPRAPLGVASMAGIHLLLLSPGIVLLPPGVGLVLGMVELAAAVAVAAWLGARR